LMDEARREASRDLAMAEAKEKESRLRWLEQARI